jgi:hypothetical protein
MATPNMNRAVGTMIREYVNSMTGQCGPTYKKGTLNNRFNSHLTIIWTYHHLHGEVCVLFAIKQNVLSDKMRPANAYVIVFSFLKHHHVIPTEGGNSRSPPPRQTP